ncbi:MAG: terpene cyclase/mutase family protein [Verrucomicrobiota bacterium]|jgi:hypothetical protein|nr:terpene cyclase/mutase family protein [Verrucomicrobiota bacterium]
MRSFQIGLAFIMALAVIPARADKVDDAVKKGVEFLVRSQDKRTGTFSAGSNVRPAAVNSYPMTALAIMAMASVGHQPTDPGEIGEAMKKGIEFLIRNDPRRSRSGGYYGVDGSRMYGHGITTLCLGEMLGMGVSKDQDRRIREALEQAVNVILSAQRRRKIPSHVGGWRYERDSNDSDLSATVWQLMALRSAQNAGVRVPKQNIDLAVKYLERSYLSGRNGRGEPTNLKSGFGYTPGHAPAYSTTSAGLLSMQVCNRIDAPEVIGAANWLEDFDLRSSERWFYYGTYYYSQGMQKRKDDDPNSVGSKQADLARKNVERIMLDLKKANGSWDGTTRQEKSVGKIYCTSLAILSLSVKYHFLPIYQD